MYVCVCFAVTDSQVQDAIDGGASTRAEVTRACRAGGDCGSCHGMIDQMLDERSCAMEESGPQLIAAAALRRASAA